MPRLILIIIALVLILLFILVTTLISYYKKCPAGHILVIINNKPDAYGNYIKIIKSGGSIVWPIVSTYIALDVRPFQILIENTTFQDKNAKLINSRMKFILALSSDEQQIERSFERISGLTSEQISNLSKDIIESQLRSFFFQNNFDLSDREGLKIQLIKSINEPLKEFGIDVLNLDLIDVKYVV